MLRKILDNFREEWDGFSKVISMVLLIWAIENIYYPGYSMPEGKIVLIYYGIATVLLFARATVSAFKQ